MTKTIQRIALATTFLAAHLLLAATANAATYYVSASTGNDQWSGTSATVDGKIGPWKTFAKVTEVKLKPGDQVLLRRGDTWNEELRPQGSGTAK